MPRNMASVDSRAVPNWEITSTVVSSGEGISISMVSPLSPNAPERLTPLRRSFSA
jgi:hypothetical protein